MYKDKFGKNRLKLGLHMHTTLSDGKLTPEEAAKLYSAAGYDAISLTDHNIYGEETRLCGMQILSGCEYNVGTSNSIDGVYHILGILMAKKPYIMKWASVGEIIDAIHDAGGLAILAHPAWSLNTPKKIMSIRGLDGIEIYNAGSNFGHNRRADSSLIVDMLANENVFYPLYATDDAHDYQNELANSYIMLECESTDRLQIVKALREGKFYATQGPEIHLSRTDSGNFRVDSSEVCEIVFLSNMCYTHRVFTGDALTFAEYSPRAEEKYIRAYVTDKDGKTAWSQIIINK